MKILIAGGTGQVGQEILKSLENVGNHEVKILVRKHTSNKRRESFQEEVFNFQDLSAYPNLFNHFKPDLVICALGTTMKKAGSIQAFNEVDRDYPLRLIHAFKDSNPEGVFALVSSVGADRPRGVYLRAKNTVESELMKSGLSFVVARPSFLLGEREECRMGEELVKKVLTRPYLFFAEKMAKNSKNIWKYAPIKAEQVAKALVRRSIELVQSSDKTLKSVMIEGRSFY